MARVGCFLPLRHMFKHEKLNLLIFIVLVLLQLLGVVGLLTRFHPFYLSIMIPLFFWGGISTTLYLHRYLTHRGFEMPEWLKFIFATGSAVMLAGDPVTWVGDHRYHHLKSDTDEDIHSPVHGFPYAHMMWLIRKPLGSTFCPISLSPRHFTSHLDWPECFGASTYRCWSSIM